jgi:hypothetical protein
MRAEPDRPYYASAKSTAHIMSRRAVPSVTSEYLSPFGLCKIDENRALALGKLLGIAATAVVDGDRHGVTLDPARPLESLTKPAPSG